MAIEAVHQRASDRSEDIAGYKLREVTIGQALIVLEYSGQVETMISLGPYNESVRIPSDIWDEFCVYSTTEDNNWTEHFRGLISIQKPSSTNEVDGERQIQYDESSRKLAAAETQLMPSNFQFLFILHPATLDSCFRPLFAAIGAEQGPIEEPIVPTFIDEIYVAREISNEPGHALVVYVDTKRVSRLISTSLSVVHEADIKPMITIKGLTCTSLGKNSMDEAASESRKLCYEMLWKADPEFLTEEQMNALCAHVQPPPNEIQKLRVQEQAGFY
ncbi:hypothetical protein MMC11_004491 [Xylographa trunciseda]|nr:hypothetical protein [Xylographa trunciseda]